MRFCLLLILCPIIFVSCSNLQEYNKKQLLGNWVEPIPGMSGFQGISLERDGKACSINMATLRYESWKYEKGKLILNGTSIGNKVNCSFSDTLNIIKLTSDSLQLMKDNCKYYYSRAKEKRNLSTY